METLKIAIVSDWFYPKIGGIETHIHELALSLLRAGHEPHVITHTYPDNSDDDSVFPYHVHRVKWRIYIRKHHIVADPIAFNDIRILYKQYRFDLTHGHSFYSPLVHASIWYSGKRGVAKVVTSHSLLPRSSIGLRASLLLLTPLARKTNVFISVSSIVHNDTSKLLVYARSRARALIIPNGIDTGFWRPPEPEERETARRQLGVDDSVVITAVGRFTSRKAMHLVPLLARLAWERGGRKKPVTVLLVGNGPSYSVVEKAARRYAKPPGLRVRLLGFRPREGLRTVYWASDMLVVPSRLEAFSIVSLEAIACGVPVVGFRDSGVADIVQSTGSGLAVSSTADFVEAIARLIVDNDYRQRLALRGLLRVQQLYSWSTIARRVLEAYRIALNTDSSGGVEERGKEGLLVGGNSTTIV